LAEKDAGYGCVLCEKTGKGITTFPDHPEYLSHIKDDHSFLDYAGEATFHKSLGNCEQKSERSAHVSGNF